MSLKRRSNAETDAPRQTYRVCRGAFFGIGRGGYNIVWGAGSVEAGKKMGKEGKKVLTKGMGRGILSELSDTAVDTEKKSEKS